MSDLRLRPLLLGVEEAAVMLGIGRSTLYGLLRRGELRAIHIGRSTRLTMAELERYVDALHQRTLT